MSKRSFNILVIIASIITVILLSISFITQLNITLKNEVEPNDYTEEYLGENDGEGGGNRVDKPNSYNNCYSLTYNCGSQWIAKNSNPSAYTLFNHGKTYPGWYKITASLKNGWKWDDGSTKQVNFYCSISQRSVSPKLSCSNKEYDGTTTASCRITGLNNACSSDDVQATINGTCTFSSKEVGNNKTVTCTNISLTGRNAEYYKLSSSKATTTSSITKADAVITCQNKYYTGYSQTIATCSGGTISNATRINAGSNTVTCKADSNHNDASGKTCYIYKANPILNIEPSTNSVYINKSVNYRVSTNAKGTFNVVNYNNSVATINNTSLSLNANQNGNIQVIGKNKGQTTITINFIPDGNNYNGGTLTANLSVNIDYSKYQIQLSPSKLYLAKDGDEARITVQVLDENGTNVRENIVVSSNSYLDITKSIVNEPNGYYLTNKSKNNPVDSTSVTVCLENDLSKCESYTVKIYCNKWTEINYDTPAYFSNNNYPQYFGIDVAHRQATCVYFPTNSCENIDNNSFKGKKCSKIYYRCGGCGNTPTYEQYACYGNSNSLENATAVNWQIGSSEMYPYKINNVSYNDCVLNPSEIITCDNSNIVQSELTKNLNACSGTLNFNDDFGSSCSTVNESSFYKIVCMESLSVNFTSSENSTIKENLGFNNKINISSTVKCQGTFTGADSFIQAYRNIERNLSLLNITDEQRYDYLNQKQKLINQLNDYNNWNGISYNMGDTYANTTINGKNYGLQGGNTTITKLKDKELSGNQYDLNISGLENPYDFIYEVKLDKTFNNKMAYYNNQTGLVQYENCTSCISLDKKIYATDTLIKDKKITYNITVGNLGYDKKWTAKSQCSLNVIKDNIIYRSVDTDNPFVSDERTIGQNWRSSNYDFSNIIVSKNYDSPLYEFDISTDNIRNIRKDTSTVGIGAYFGKNCEYSNNKYICNFIRDDKYFSKIYIGSE